MEKRTSKFFSYKKYLTEGILLVGLSLFLYTLSFIYDYGYGLYFSIPTTYISFSTANLFSTGLILFVALLTTATYLFSLDIRNKDNLTNEWLNLRNTILLLVITTIIFWIYDDGFWWLWIIPVALIVWIGLRHFFFPIYFYKNMTYVEKVDKDLQLVRLKVETIGDYIFNFAVFKGAMYVLGAFALFGFVLNLGYYHARSQKEFYVTPEYSEFVVVRFTENKAISVEINDKNELQNRIKFLDMESKEYTFERKEIGKLKN